MFARKKRVIKYQPWSRNYRTFVITEIDLRLIERITGELIDKSDPDIQAGSKQLADGCAELANDFLEEMIAQP